MQFMFLIYFDPAKARGSVPVAAGQYNDWFEYTTALQDAKVWKAGEPLQDGASATTLRLRGDERVITDGPYVETKEELVGFYIVETDTLDTALEWAGKMPEIGRGGVEVRPVMVFEPAQT